MTLISTKRMSSFLLCRNLLRRSLNPSLPRHTFSRSLCSATVPDEAVPAFWGWNPDAGEFMAQHIAPSEVKLRNQALMKALHGADNFDEEFLKGCTQVFEGIAESIFGDYDEHFCSELLHDDIHDAIKAARAKGSPNLNAEICVKDATLLFLTQIYDSTGT